MKPHKHAEVIEAWAKGQPCQYRFIQNEWVDLDQNCADFGRDGEYRIKPAEPDKVYPETNLDAGDFCNLGFGGMISTESKKLANAAIRRAIDDGQVVTIRDFYNAINIAHKAGAEGASLNVAVHLAGIKFK